MELFSKKKFRMKINWPLVELEAWLSSYERI